MTDVKKLGRYEIIKELGRGGMGIVLLGRDPMIDRQVALKIIKLTDEEDISDSNKELLERFFIEAKAAGKLTHPNIVTIYDVGAEGGKSFMALEFIDGDDLAAVINKSGPMDLERAATIASQVADGLAFAHENGIIHRDIKPGNILVQGNDRVKITDFGLARLQTSHSLTQTGHAVGSPSYMSPEQVQGIHLDGRSDIFSLGVMFYEMVTAKRPFVGDSMSSLIFKIITDKPPLPSNLIEGIPKPVDAVISKMLAKSPDDRYQSCHEVKKAFDALAAGDVKAAELTTGAFGSVSGDVTVDFDTTAITGKKSGSKIGVIAGFAALIIAGVAFWFMLGKKGVEEKAIVPTAQPPKLARVEQKEPVKVEPKEPVKTEQKTPTETKKPAAVAATERASVAESPPVVKVSPPALSVTSKPSGAEVFIDKVSFGRTPLYTEKLEPGKRKVLLALKGYDKESRLVTLEDDKKTTLSITLNRSMGILKIGKPKGAQVFLDGKKIGAVPVVFNSKPGSYKLRLTLEGYHPYSSTVKIAAGKSVSPKVKLAKLGYGEINVFAIPWADIYINGKKSGTTPKLIKKALEGKTTIRLVNPGYRPFNTTVDVQKDKRVEVSHNFSDAESLGSAQDNDQKAEEATGSLAISSKPAGVVFINGKHYGTTPVKTKGLKKGVYTIVIKREGMPDYKRKVTVVEDIVTRLSIE